MKHITVGQRWGEGKIANVQCVPDTPLKTFAIKEECYLLLILTEGRVSFTVDGHGFHAVAPCFICFDQHADPVVVSKTHAKCHAVYFHPSFLNVNMTFELLQSAVYEDLAENHDLFMLKPFLDGTRIIPIEDNALEKILTAFDGMTNELCEQRDWYWSCRSRSYFMELILLLERMYSLMGFGAALENPSAAFAAEDPHFKAALMFVETQYTSDIDLSQIAASCGMSRAAVSALFKQETGLSPLQYLMTHRVRIAKKQLAFTDIPIKEIAARCGFKTVPHFSRVFKEQTGKTPARYRAEEVQSRKDSMSLQTLIERARERLAAEDIVFEDPDFPHVCLFLSEDGTILEYTGFDDRTLSQLFFDAGVSRIERMICMRKSGFLAMPPIAFLAVIRSLHPDNGNTTVTLQEREGYFTKTVADVLTNPKRQPRLHGDALQALYEALVAKQNACLDPDFLSIGIHTLHDALVSDELLTEVADFLEDYTAFAIEDKRYTAFGILLGAGLRNAAYYHLVYALLHCAEQDGDPDAIERLHGSMLAATEPINLFLLERGIAKLREMGCDEHAQRMQEDSERVRRERRFFRSYRYESEVLDVVFTEVERREMQVENNEDPGSHPEVAVIGYALNVGDVRGKIDGDERKQVFAEQEPLYMDEIERCFAVVRADYERLLSAAKIGKSIRVWRNLREPHSACGFAFVCDALKEYDCPLTVVDVPEECPSWGVVRNYVPYLLHEQTVSEEEKRHFADMWQRVKEENAPLRAFVGDKLISLSAEHYDDDLLRLLPEGRAVWVGETLGRLSAPELYSKSGVFITWYEHRLQKLIEQGVFEVVVNDEDVHEMVIRRKTDEPLFAEDVYVVARSRIAKVERGDSLPAPLLYTMLSSTGKLYFFENDPVGEMIDTLTKADDTEIMCWVTLWGNMPPSLDMPSFAARQAVLRLNEQNAQTQLLVQGEKARQTRLLKDSV